MARRIIAIGGGEIRNKTTLQIDEYVAYFAKLRSGERRAVATFVGAASHDSMPYFNSFRKTYTSVFDIKAEVALSVYGEMDFDKIASKIKLADCIYIGGGDTKFLIEHLKKTNILPLIMDAYNSGVTIAGMSAGAICWFETMYTDFDIMRGVSNEYKILGGLGLVGGVVCPHYNQRMEEFDDVFSRGKFQIGYAIEDNCALEIVDEQVVGCISAGGNAYRLERTQNGTTKTKLPHTF